MTYSIFHLFSSTQSENDEYQAACRLWQIYLQTRAEFVQPGDGDDDDDDGDDMGDNAGMSTEEEASFYSSSLLLCSVSYCKSLWTTSSDK